MLTTLKTPAATKWTWSGAGYVRKSPGEKQLAAPNRRQVYKRARYYDTSTGEFISRDPLEYVDGMSQYRGYFLMNGLDPWGEEVFICNDGSIKNVPDPVSDATRKILNDSGCFSHNKPKPEIKKPPIVRPPVIKKDYSACDGYDVSNGTTCKCCDGKDKKDPYPAKAKAVCKRFLDLYHFSDKVKCVAKCLGGDEKTTIIYDECEKRNLERLVSHIACYYECGFVPTSGIPEGGAEVGWEMLLFDAMRATCDAYGGESSDVPVGGSGWPQGTDLDGVPAGGW